MNKGCIMNRSKKVSMSLGAALAAMLPAMAMADFTLTDKNNANGVTILTGNTATSTYIMETQYNQPFQPSTAGTTQGFRFDSTNSVPATLLTSPTAGTDLPRGTGQKL